MIDEVLLNMAVTVDGKGYAGMASEVDTPKLEPMMEEFGGGGMSSSVDVEMGAHGKLTASITFDGFDVSLYGHLNIGAGSLVPFTVRGVTQDADGTKHAHVIKMRGKVGKLDEGTWKRSEKVPLKLDLTLHYYERLRDDVELIVADPVNMVFRVNGVDQLAETRAALGL